MTKSPEGGANEVTDQAKKEAARTGTAVCTILARMLQRAKASRDKARVRKIVRAQKYLGCRNARKRKGKS